MRHRIGSSPTLPPGLIAGCKFRFNSERSASSVNQAPFKAAPSRRALLQTAAWTAPTIAFAAAAPTASASTPPCTPVQVQLIATATSTNPLLLTAVGPNGEIYTVSIQSTTTSNTITGETDATGIHQEFNLTQGSSGWAGNLVAGDQVVTGFGDPGAIVLNQRAQYSGGTSTSGGVPLAGEVSQTLTFTFRKGSTVINPVDVSFTIFDISSVQGSHWRGNYWDTVGFSVAPASVNSATNPGVGSGTISDPFHRATGNEGTGTSPVPFSDGFTFDSFPSGTQMVYAQLAGRQGWQFISISGITFTTEENCPAS